MSKEFYKYIAKKIVESTSNFEDGSRYCLKLDNIDMVKGVDLELKNWLSKLERKDEYIYSDTYKTYTIELDNGSQVVVASKLEGITNDFLTTLRNENLLDKKYSLLIISYETIDSIESGTKNLATKGMPFHSETIKSDIDKKIKDNNFTLFEKEIINESLKNLEMDKYTDKSSLFEYAFILSIIDKNKLENDDYYKLGFLPDEEQNINSKIDKKRIEQNRNFFNQIDEIYKESQMEEKLEKDFDNKFIKDLEKKKKQNKNWYENVNYKDVIESYNRKKKKKEEEFKIEEIFVNNLDESNVWDIKDGTSSAKQRNTNLFIFNPDKKEKIEINIKCNMRVKKNSISLKGIYENNLRIENNSIYCEIESNNIKFAEIKIQENKKYTIRICIIELEKDFLDYFKTKELKIKKNSILVPIDESVIKINPDKENKKEDIIKKGKNEFTCNYDEKLILDIDKDLFNHEEEYKITLSSGAIHIPIVLKELGRMKKQQLNIYETYRLKFKNKESLEYRENEEISCKNQAYYTKSDFKDKLKLEKFFIDNLAFAIDLEDMQIKNLKIGEEIKNSYIELLEEYKKNKTLPSLSFYKGELLKKAKNYIEIINKAFENIEKDRALTKEESDLLYLGCVFIKNDGILDTILMSPLHPLNIAYQLKILEEKGIHELSDNLIAKLSSLNLIPYIKYEKDELFLAVDESESLEWHYYKKFYKKEHLGSRNYVKKIVKDKIDEYRKHFAFLFQEIGNNFMNINVVNMGNCKEIFNGFIEYYIKELSDNKESENYLKFRINIYSELQGNNYFYKLSSFTQLKKYLESLNSKDIDINELALLLVNNIKIYYYNLNMDKYEYSHITFYEMDSKNPNSTGKMDNITTAVSLGGIVSGIPSILDGEWFKTGFGYKYIEENFLTKLARYYNSLYRVSKTSSSYDPNDVFVTGIKKDDNKEMNKLFESSNWIVFIDPQVDLSYFQMGSESVNSDLMIIHYSDNFSSSTGYDDITVTKKSKQYSNIIKEQLEQNNIHADNKSMSSIINLFNAINGKWLLKLIYNKKLYGAADSYFSREKLSILSAIKLSLAYNENERIIWIPISLEELLRVSKGLGLSQKDSILSAKNLGFEKGATCDDILLVGIEEINNKLKLYTHIVEVKIGENDNRVIEKATQQIENTYDGFKKALSDENNQNIENKLIRNYFIDIVLDSSKKMDLYNIYPECNYKKVLDDYRQRLINGKFEFCYENNYGKGSIISFKTNAIEKDITEISNDIKKLEFPKQYGFEYMIKSISEIRKSLIENDLEIIEEEENFEDTEIIYENTDISDKNMENIEEKTLGIEVEFGIDISNGKKLIWNPNDTEQIFHTNTGIIGTMGTGKTQFTKSMIAQLYMNRKNNFKSDKIGILIFDYKGDYNENNKDFVELTNAKIFKPYHLPFNPLAIIESKVFKPLLPRHIGNTFKDTIAKANHLGNKQKNILFQCIEEAYERKGIEAENPNTWNKVAPTFEEVYEIYEKNDEISKNDSLAAVMQKLHDFQIFESNSLKTKSLFDVLDGVVVIDLSGYDSDIQSMVVAITLTQFYSQMQSLGESKKDDRYRELTKLILVDEADNFMREDYEVLRKILKEGRAFGVGTILSTQFLYHFVTGADDYSKYILTWIVHHVDDLKWKDVEYIFKTNNDEISKIYSDIKKLEKHHSIVKISNNNCNYIKDEAFWQLHKKIKEENS